MEIQLLPLGQSHSDRCRAGNLRWRNMPPGLPPEMADEVMARIVAGETIRDLTNPVPVVDPAAYVPPMVSADRLRKHCEKNPEWGAKVRKLSWENFAKKSQESSHMRRRTAEMCQKGLHPMTGDNVMISHKENRRQWRQCLACRRIAAQTPPLESILAIVDVIKEKIAKGTSISEITHGRPTGGGKKNRSLILAPANKFAYLRKTNAEFDQFVREHTRDNNSRGQRIRHTRIHTAEVRDNNNEYYKIRDMIPEQNPHRDDIVARIFEDLLGGSLDRKDVPAGVKTYIAELNRLYPTKYAKFGNSPLLSLDEVMFEDGTATRGDTISRGLWD